MLNTVKNYFISAITYELFGGKGTYCNNLVEITGTISAIAGTILFVTSFNRKNSMAMIMPGVVCISTLVGSYAAFRFKSDQQELKALTTQNNSLLAQVKESTAKTQINKNQQAKLGQIEAENKCVAQHIKTLIKERSSIALADVLPLISTLTAESGQPLADAIQQNERLAPIINKILLSQVNVLKEMPTPQDMRDVCKATGEQQLQSQREFNELATKTMEDFQSTAAQQKKERAYLWRMRQAFLKDLPTVSDALRDHGCESCKAFLTAQANRIDEVLDKASPPG